MTGDNLRTTSDDKVGIISVSGPFVYGVSVSFFWTWSPFTNITDLYTLIEVCANMD